MYFRVSALSLLLKSCLGHAAGSLLLGFAIVLAAGPTAQGQVAIDTPTAIVAPEASLSNDLSAVLAKGRELESSNRWGDALTHYEEALREHRDNADLQQRHDLAKLHYSLERRYHDRSFVQSLSSLNHRQALSLYSELLQKTNTHYVHTPPWQLIAERGVDALEVACLDLEFVAANKIKLSSQEITRQMSGIRQTLAQRPLASSRDLVALADEVAQQAEARMGVPATATILEFVTAAANGLDDYSSYLTSDQLREVYSQIEGNFVGLGVELKAENGALLIVHTIPGSPAEQSGIVAGDRIVAVDGKSTSTMSTDEAASMLTGAEGTWVRVTIYTPGQQPRVLNVRREHVEVPSLEGARIIDPDFGIAYVRIPTFQKTTSRDLEAALWDLHRKGMRSLILDLRGNPGGLLTASVEVADKFLTEGNIVSTRGRSPQEDFNYQAHYGGTWRVPLVVLIDRDSASASEIFAAAIKDNNRGRVVGETSFGKGSVQGIFPLGYAGAGVRLTTAKFYSPLGAAISHRGVEPHEVVRVTARPTNEGFSPVPSEADDAILQAGIQAARSRVAAR